MIVGCDTGLDGGLCILHPTPIVYKTPTISIETKPAVYVNALDSKGKKQIYKSGPNKGQVKRKIKTPAKVARELDLFRIQFLLEEAETFIIEQPGNSIGNSARSTASTYRRYGELIATATLTGCKVITVSAAKWKKDLNLTKDKLQCVEKAEELSGLSFRTERGALRDGEAEAFLIAYWYKNHGSK
jgi:hypothetical protein